jgi:hypothetical protein
VAETARIARRLLLPLVLLALGAVAVGQAPLVDAQSTVTEDRAARREVLTSVLAQPEFQHSAATVLMDRLRQVITRRLAELWDRLGGPGVGSRSAATAFAWVVGLLGLAALTWWLVKSLAEGSAGHVLGLSPPAATRRRSSRAWAREALLAHRAGDPREAARCAYRATLARLEEDGEWRQDAARTPREYLRLLPAAHRHQPAVADLTARFERAWYGADAGSPADTRAMLARLEELGCLASGHAS